LEKDPLIVLSTLLDIRYIYSIFPQLVFYSKLLFSAVYSNRLYIIDKNLRSYDKIIDVLNDDLLLYKSAICISINILKYLKLVGFNSWELLLNDIKDIYLHHNIIIYIKSNLNIRSIKYFYFKNQLIKNQIIKNTLIICVILKFFYFYLLLGF